MADGTPIISGQLVAVVLHIPCHLLTSSFVVQVAKQFQEELQPLVEWLGTAERKVKSLQLVPTDEEKIQLKIREHKVFNLENRTT